MRRINLLPWREARRRERQRRFLLAAGGSALVALVLVLGAYLQVAAWRDAQQNRNAYLRQQISAVETRMQAISRLRERKADVLARMNVIERLQRRRAEAVRMFNAVARAVPTGVYLRRLTETVDGLEVEGVARSNASVSELMRRLAGNPGMANPRLDVIERRRGGSGPVRHFTLTVERPAPAGGDAEEGA
jgi:type IV pilus assembly protein PilN